jgi:DNA-binding CsgD family transcriptional regulator/tetratricopeptide (TPR) repeat protein
MADVSARPELLEREAAFEALARALGDAANGTGSLVLVEGEAGVGKTALLRRFVKLDDEEMRTLWGSCDPLFTPRPLGPFLDVAETVGGDLLATVESDAKPYDVAASLMRELASASRPTLLVLDDMHWADEASLDVLRLVARRIEALRIVVVVSYRSHEVGPAHALRLVIGELASTRAIRRVHLDPLSLAAVASLADPYGVDAVELHRKTAGNPLFVTEVLAAGEIAIPETVRDAVLARAARLCFSAQRLLEVVSVVPQQAELWLLTEVEGSAESDIDECLGSGLLTSTRDALEFRHELVRLAIEDSLRPDRRAALHGKVLAALEQAPAVPVDAARLAHHAEGAADAEAVLRYAPAAALRASALGAHSEAAAQYARALRFADALGGAERSDLLERLSYECYLTGEFDRALETQETALELRRQVGDPVAEGDALRTFSRLLRYTGSVDEAFATAHAAVEQLERTAPRRRELAMAYCNLSHLYMSVEDVEQTFAWGEKARALAEDLGDDEPLLYALGNMAQLAMLTREPDAPERVTEIFERAREARLDEHAGRTFVMWTWWAPRGRWYREADEHLDAGLEFCESRGLDLWRFYLLAYRARSWLDRGRWDDAVETARLVIDDQRSSPMPRIVALSVLGLVRARRGDPDVWTILDEAWGLASSTAELQRIAPAAAARAEAAWLEGRPALVATDIDTALDLARVRHQDWIFSELAYWTWRAGRLNETPEGGDPYALQMSGQWGPAAAAWDELESPYEAALARADGNEAAQRQALDELNRLSAKPAAAIVARRLRERGVRGVARGPRPATRDSPAGLTRRETEILDLLASGMRNSEISDRLVLSRRTVDHHVSAILRKLDARTRGAAVAKAAQLGLLQDR